jgi:hypothetical protein
MFLFANYEIILLIVFTALIYHYNNLSLKVRFFLIISIPLIIIFITLAGSRAGMLSILMLALFSLLAVNKNFKVSKNQILSSLILIPIAILLFIGATYIRDLGTVHNSTPLSILNTQFLQNHLKNKSLNDHVNTISYRLGFLDYSTELITLKTQFSKIINPEYYFKSIIDNALTPGFDIFDIPRSSHAINEIRNGKTIINKNQMGSYRSDQMGIYGEYYVLFRGYPAIIVFFVIAFIFQKTYELLNRTHSIKSCIYTAILLKFFYLHLNSYGIDWLFIDIVAAFLTVFLFGRFVFNSHKKDVANIISAPNDIPTQI